MLHVTMSPDIRHRFISEENLMAAHKLVCGGGKEIFGPHILQCTKVQ